jgi:hypothetical protein
MPLQYVMSEKTGSIICIRLEYSSRKTGSSIFFLILSLRFSAFFETGIYNVRLGVLPPREATHLERNVQFLQSEAEA